MSATPRRSVRRVTSALLAAAATVVAGAVLAGPAAASTGGSVAAAPVASASSDATLKGLVLSGGCPGVSALKNVTVAPTTNNLWLPLRFSDGATFKPLNRWIFPAQITVIGEGLKSRHLQPGESYTRPWPIPSLRPVTCEFDGATKEDGPFHVVITGTVVGSGSLLGR